MSLDYFLLIGGLGQFLFGMYYLENAIKDLASRNFRSFLKNNTNTKLRAILSGTAITAILQSSSLVSLMTLAFVGAGILNLTNAVGIIIGANLGTTITGWIFAILGFKLKIKSINLLLIGISGLIITLANPKNKMTAWARFGIGFALLFIGLEGMKESIATFASTVDISIFTQYGIVAFFILGFFITAIIQSSSASMVIALSALNSQMINFHQAVAFVIGSDLGTTITVFFGVLSGGAIKKRVALSHFLYNFICNLLGLALIYILIYFVKDILKIDNNLLALVACHTFLNIFGMIIFFPFIDALSKFLEGLFQSSSEDDGVDKLTLSTGIIEYLQDKLDSYIKDVHGFNQRILDYDQVQDRKDILNKYEFLKLKEGKYSKLIFNSIVNEIDKKEIVNLRSFLEVIRLLVNSVKALKDVEHSLSVIISEAGTSQHKILRECIDKLNIIFIQSFIFQPPPIYAEEALLKVKLNEQNQIIYRSLANGSISESEASSLLNILTEVARANYEFAEALKLLTETKQQ